MRSVLAPSLSLPLAATLLACGLTGCASRDEAAGRPDLTRYYDQEISWEPCSREQDRTVRDETRNAGRTAECARLTVPHSYDDPAKGELRLALMRYRAADRDHRLGSLVVGFGGPGASGLGQLGARGPDGFGKAAGRYDLVAFDPRGAGASSPVRCGTGDGLPDAARARDDDADGAGEPAELADRIDDRAKALHDCAKRTGPVLPYLGTVHAAKDLDVLRAALGEDRLNYLGYAQGTRLGAAYAHRYPHKVGRMVMDSVDDPAPDLRRNALARTAAYQKALRHAVEICTRRGAEDCILGSDTDRAMETVTAAFNRLDEHPLPWVNGTTLDREAAVTQTMGLLRSREGLPETPNLLAAIVHRLRPGEAAHMAREAVARAGGKDAGDRAGAGSVTASVNCADTRSRYTADQVASAYDDFVEASPVFGPALAVGMAACTGWPQVGDDGAHDVAAPRAPKILLHTSEFDPATPVAWLRRMARALGPSAVTMTDTGGGHGIYGSSDADCVNEKVDAFLLDGRLPADRTRCT
ncbi:alpha/beta fold hydrolase [Streptomyces roseoverticillatus]|uniref:alpha/beta hydrolase n=1 Tax=Streptomyces roseoverticillatus TaxID=66429 RepID=UPI001F3ED546|nr:alpha/beta hydrolase [Streptomyces roseoverticillatus]MCF3101866.1 alpha/beta fold hydrolase [Streptomyces roseoverticillatus]